MSWRKAVSLSLLLAVALAVAGCGSSSPSTPTVTYPLQNLTTGAVRIYHVVPADEMESPYDETSTVMGTETFGGETCVKIRSVDDDGTTTTTEYSFYKAVANGVALAGSRSEGGEETIESVAQVYPTLKPGETFTQEAYTWTATTVESVTVPAGTFAALKVNLVSGLYTMTFWAAPDIGIVKAVEPDGSTMSLTSYSN